jgi:hypothetical protein
MSWASASQPGLAGALIPPIPSLTTQTMILSNFTLLGTVGTGLDKTFCAEVTVTTSGFLRKKLERRKVFRRAGGYWKFADTGKFCPGTQCEELEQAHQGMIVFAKLHSNNATDS